MGKKHDEGKSVIKQLSDQSEDITVAKRAS